MHDHYHDLYHRCESISWHSDPRNFCRWTQTPSAFPAGRQQSKGIENMNSASMNLSRMVQSEHLETVFISPYIQILCFVVFSVIFILTHICGNGCHNPFNALTLERTLHHPSFLVTPHPLPNNLLETAASPQLSAPIHVHRLFL